MNEADIDVSYRPGIRGWWAYWRPLEALRDGDGVQWRALWRRGRLSGRLRQSEQERRYWRNAVNEADAEIRRAHGG